MIDKPTTCAKCGCDWATRRFIAWANVIERTCEKCGYQWPEYPVDARPPEPAQEMTGEALGEAMAREGEEPAT